MASAVAEQSMTRTGPMKRSSGTWSSVAPPLMKCSGASTCVPVCAPNENADNVSVPPFSKLCVKSSLTGALPG